MSTRVQIEGRDLPARGQVPDEGGTLIRARREHLSIRAERQGRHAVAPRHCRIRPEASRGVY